MTIYIFYPSVQTLLKTASLWGTHFCLFICFDNSQFYFKYYPSTSLCSKKETWWSSLFYIFHQTLQHLALCLTYWQVLHTEKTKSRGKIHFGLFGFAYQLFHGCLEDFLIFTGNDLFESEGQSEFYLESERNNQPWSPRMMLDLEAVLLDGDEMRWPGRHLSGHDYVLWCLQL